MSVAECPVDLNFIVDSSGSISRSDWTTSLNFVADVVRRSTIGPNNVQVAFVVFSNVATVEWGLTRYQDSASLINAILNVRYIGSSTNLNDALYLTRTQVFAPGGGTRANAIKATIILTDGVDNVPEVGTPLTLQNATRCWNAGIRLFAIGVTDGVDDDRLIKISRANYRHVNDFDALQNIVDQLSPINLCPEAGTEHH